MTRHAEALLAILAVALLPNPGMSQTTADKTSSASSGTVKGVVRYQADPKRRWRYARYYVKPRGKGELAEAVLALKPRKRQRPEPRENPDTAKMDQKEFQFVPETLAIQAGERVKFLNSDKQLHNVKCYHRLHSFNVNMPSGAEHVETFEKAGNLTQPYQLGCVYHSAMRAWIFVFDHANFQVTKADGAFELKNVPPGEYKLEMVHPAGELEWSQTIEVKAGETNNIVIEVSPDNLSQK